MKNLLVFLLLAVTISAIVAKPLKLSKVAQQLRDLEDEGDNDNDNDNAGDNDNDNGDENNDWQDGEYEEYEEDDTVAVFVLAEPSGYAVDVNVLVFDEDYEDDGWSNDDFGDDIDFDFEDENGGDNDNDNDDNNDEDNDIDED